MAQDTKRASFTSKLGIIATVAGSAIGLGNIWRFPYITGENGGASFLFIYLICIIIAGLPVMLGEFVIGRHTRKNTVGAFKQLEPRKPWFLSGWFGVFSAVVTLGFYSVVAGWGLKYIYLSGINAFSNKGMEETDALFSGFISGGLEPIIWQLIFLILTGVIVIVGVQKGIEKCSKVLMPILLLILIVLVINAFTLDGAKAGLSFLFKLDFSSITPKAIFIALGHAFFTLSLGMGVMITYGSYISDGESLNKTALQVIIADTGVALLAGIAIFPAVFTFGIDPQEGAGLAFVTLPVIFSNMPGGYILSVLFFFLLAIAAITSAISMLEVPVAFLTEEFKLSRAFSTSIIIIISGIFGMLCSLSNGSVDITLFNMSLMGFAEFLASNILLPSIGFIIAIYVGWFMDKKILLDQLSMDSKSMYYKIFSTIIRFITPIAVIFVFLNSIGVIKF